MTAIELAGVGKRYRQYDEEPLLVKRLLRPHRRREKRDLWALRDISFTAQRGETLGVIGRNGSGKTTLLRLLSGVSAPSEGRLRVAGTVAPLIGIGVGFNHELTGRENVHVNGRLLGMTPQQVHERFDEIVEFSEIEAFIDTPVKYYSSGMYLRLAFSVAVHTDPEIFLLDELLAVGDLAFQLKCNDKMNEIQERGATIVVVTHNMQVLNRLAKRVVILDAGRAIFDGDVEEGLGIYHEIMQREQEQHRGAAQREAVLRQETGEGWWAGTAHVRASLTDEQGTPTRHFASGELVRVGVEASFDEAVADPMLVGMVKVVGLGGQGRGGIFITHPSPGDYTGQHGPDQPLHGQISLRNRLLEGSYALRVEVRDREGNVVLGATDWEMFAVTSAVPATGVVNLEPSIEIGGRPVLPPPPP